MSRTHDSPASDPASTPMTPSQRFRLTCEMHDLGVAMMRQKFHRDTPHATEAQVDDMLRRWLRERPGAEFGDASGPGIRVRQP